MHQLSDIHINWCIKILQDKAIIPGAADRSHWSIVYKAQGLLLQADQKQQSNPKNIRISSRALRKVQSSCRIPGKTDQSCKWSGQRS